MATEQKRIVVVAMDGSYHSGFAFQWYLDNIRKPNDVVYIVHCLERLRNEPFHTAMGTADVQAVCDVLKREEEEEKILIDKLKELLVENKLVGEVKAATGGKPGELVIKVANEVGADTIVCGSRGHGKLRRTVIGVVSDYILHHSEVPVTICRHKPHNPDLRKQNSLEK
uniref:Uncharacterized protein LOC111105974 n=1 Tax=Crassostrea virginica TaxID=6565 RepID=A0A8B8AYE9_CRAVI|nr:uncharacterized protein LOC111105974 [Crassostrea virginica]XP_022300119.1 uncharacterized protein LOC111108486 [Crassostrea virginica]|mmetsp:Transcript_13776/g.24484  ORF Transcript_13776/g.24484 Transcript_13776/m.24484 type:complete len:169 (+) Transcript_13776:190-696(+)